MMNSGKSVKEALEDLTRKQRSVFLLLIALTCVLGIALPFAVSAWGGYSRLVSRPYIAGELSDEDVVAPSDFSFVDEVATLEVKERAKRQVMPIFRYSIASTVFQRNRFSALVEAAKAGHLEESFPEHASDPRLESILEGLSERSASDTAVILGIADESFGELLQEGIFSSSELMGIANLGKNKVNIEDSDLGFTYEGMMRSVSDLVTEEGIGSWVLRWISAKFPQVSSGDALLASDIVSYAAQANVEFDPVTTSTEIYNAEQRVPSVVLEVKQGDYILRRDTVVSEQDLRILQRIEEESKVSTPRREILGHIVYTICLVSIVVYFICTCINYSYRLFSYVGLILAGVDISLVLNFVMAMRLSYEGVRYTDPFLPVLFVPVLATFITGHKMIGLSLGLLYAGLLIMFPTAGTFTFFYVLLLSVAVIVTKRQGNQRIDLIYHALGATVSVAVITLFLSIFSVQPYSVIFTSVVASIVNTVFSFVVVSILLPILEKIFNIPTTFRLYELAHTDSPTLTRLSLVAPGTFNHSKNVSEMAYYACKAIGANAELARVAGLYHDIGKAEHPEYFIENQTGKNAHDDLNKTLSAAVIKSHVRLGVEKAKDAGLPQEVIDIIGEHHGNDLIKFFYNAALREGKEKNQSVSEEDFRYNGTVPQTPESGVVMLADCSEAATRTLKNPNHQKYEKFINSIIIDKLNYSQLTSSQLTLNDLDLVKEAFVRYLMGRDHHRIEYTKD